MQYSKVEIVVNRQLGPGHHLLVVRAEQQLPEFQAGQFLNLRCVPNDIHSLMRPFSILGADPAAGEISIYYKELGRQSTALAGVPAGSRLDCLFPLGHGFPWQKNWQRVALIGGGVGLAPLLYMAEQLQNSGTAVQCEAYFGGNTAADLVPGLLARYNLTTNTATMDGSEGHKGNVVDLYCTEEREYDVIYTCGPNPMMAALKAALPPAQVVFASLEEYMACGVGACLGCVAAISEDDGVTNRPVCKDGPVFPLHAVNFSH